MVGNITRVILWVAIWVVACSPESVFNILEFKASQISLPDTQLDSAPVHEEKERKKEKLIKLVRFVV